MEDKACSILQEYKITQNIPSRTNIIQDGWDWKTFKKQFKIVVMRLDPNEIEFDLIGIHPFLTNTFRRIILSDVPSMAIEKVHIYNNTSIIQDEVLAHRLGLVPLKADPRLFETKLNASDESNEHDTLEFELKIKCSVNKDSNKDSSRADDMFKNNKVYSKHMKWLPIGSQAESLSELQVGPVHDDILIAKMRPGHELDLKLIAVKSIGKDHAKFSPVATAFYRLLPDIKIVKEVEGEAAERLQKCFSPGVISVRNTNGKKTAVVKDARYDTGSRNVFRYDDLKDTVVMTRIQDHFIFTIESVGALPPEVIFKEAVTLLKNKCLSLLQELVTS